jgi:hypothetical protein
MAREPPGMVRRCKADGTYELVESSAESLVEAVASGECFVEAGRHRREPDRAERR